MKRSLFAAAMVLLAVSLWSCKKETTAIVNNEAPVLTQDAPAGNPPKALEYTLSEGVTWIVGAHTKNSQDLTANYTDIDLQFQSGEVLVATTRNNAVNGTWTIIDGSHLVINFEDAILSELNGTWPITSMTEKTISLSIEGILQTLRLDVKE